MDSTSQTFNLTSQPEISLDSDPIDEHQAAGNWSIFKRRCAFLDATPVLDHAQNVEVRRRYALAYLGQRAQLRGGVFHAAKPMVFTEAVISALAKRNTAARYARYPWLAQMMALIAALDDAQYNVVSQEGNVLAFPEAHGAVGISNHIANQ